MEYEVCFFRYLTSLSFLETTLCGIISSNVSFIIFLWRYIFLWELEIIIIFCFVFAFCVACREFCEWRLKKRTKFVLIGFEPDIKRKFNNHGLLSQRFELISALTELDSVLWKIIKSILSRLKSIFNDERQALKSFVQRTLWKNTQWTRQRRKLFLFISQAI